MESVDRHAVVRGARPIVTADPFRKFNIYWSNFYA